MQMLFFNPTELGNTTFGINGPNYAINGVRDCSSIAAVTDGLTLQGSATYNDATQANSPCLKATSPGTPDVIGQCITAGLRSRASARCRSRTRSAPSGTVPAFSPTFEGNLRARYDWAVGDYKAFVQVGVQLHRQHVQPAGHLRVGRRA